MRQGNHSYNRLKQVQPFADDTGVIKLNANSSSQAAPVGGLDEFVMLFTDFNLTLFKQGRDRSGVRSTWGVTTIEAGGREPFLAFFSLTQFTKDMGTLTVSDDFKV